MRKFFDRGDVVFLDFDPSLGHEQKGRRPALILTKKIFNELCPNIFIIGIPLTY